MKRLSWDSKNFGFEVAQADLTDSKDLNLEALKSEAKNQKIKLLYLNLAPEQGKSLSEDLKKLGFDHVDEKISYCLDLSQRTLGADHREVESVSIANQPQGLLDLAYLAGHQSRFYLDAKFPKEHFQMLYKTWLERSLKREIAWEVCAWVENKRALGFVSVGQSSYEHAKIGLVAVRQESQGQSIGRKLMESVVNKCIAREYKYLDLITQGANKGACHFYESLGFVRGSEVWTYHLYL